ncbi:ABC transporter substrate-binding protein [Desulfobacula toluolica]|uniref:Putative ABC-type nitrate/sulfonate/bicarbonate transport systems, periplasmic binding protein n=1 Tax=Desulfobacula toluolica (strain DSM 7467 / Tol2) TaxID=651182 RepID=K0NJ53_DESTT|nr:ABC transporter substrate-binding protein [Desulfobacula toluolica]CCK81496.1 putative ABC-type nitrate/sulfonate/bicarbonate transport systems, periplasmic binding protein [Desulfobacula toluolica Tol2]
MKDTPCIRIGHLKIVDHLILGIAALQLKKSKRNLTHSTLETIAMNSWNQVCDDLTCGNIDGAFIPSPMAIQLFASGLAIKVLMFTHRSGSIIVKNRASHIKHLSDFKGKTVLIPSKFSIQHMLFHRLLSSVGLKLGAHDDNDTDVASEVVNPFLMSEMLKNDQDKDIAGFAVAEPYGSKAVYEKIATKICLSEKLWKNHPCCVFALKTSFIENHPEAVQEVISLFTQTGQHIADAKNDDILFMAHNFLGQNKEITRQILLKADIHFNPSLLIANIDALYIIQNYMTDAMGVFKNKIDVNTLVDNSFILTALSEKNH